MSRIGKKAIVIPKDVSLSFDNGMIEVQGKYGKIAITYPSVVKISIENDAVNVVPINDESHSRAMWGTTRNNIQNLVIGVSQKFTSRLEIVGVGYRASVNKNILSVSIGYSHDIKLEIPKELEVVCEKPTLIVVSGISKQQVGQFCAVLRRLRKYDPFKGKGIKFEGQQMFRKEGKKK